MACPLTDCRDPDVRPQHPTDGADKFNFDCPRCGRFSMTETFFAESASTFPEHPLEVMEGLRRFFNAENEKGKRPCIDKGHWQQHAELFKPSVWDCPPATRIFGHERTKGKDESQRPG